MPEIDQIADLFPRDSQIIDQLRLMLRQQFSNSLQLDDDFIKNKQIGNKLRIQFYSLVKKKDCLLASFTL